MTIRGVVRYFNADRRYGKIAAGRFQYFVHGDDLVDVAELRPGQQVTFQPTESPRGPGATCVVVLTEPIAPHLRKDQP